MRRNLETRLQARWDELHLPTIVRSLRTAALLLHDRDDEDVPYRHAEEIAAAWPGARLLRHRRGSAIGRCCATRTVVRAAVAFLSGGGGR